MLIYLMETDDLLKRTLSDHLNRLDHEIIPLASIADLLELVEGSQVYPDLIMVDIRMIQHAVQHMDPDQLVDIKGKFEGIPIIVMTSNPGVLPLETAVSSGVFGYLHRPFSLSELELMLIRVTHTARMRSDVSGNAGNSGRSGLQHVNQ